MKLVAISLRNVRIRVVSSLLTMVAILVATGLYAAIMLMAEQTRDRYEGSLAGYRSVIGPKDASGLQLCLNTIFNVGDAPGLIKFRIYQELRAGRTLGRRAQLLYTIPQARGDGFSRFNFPVVGTTDEMFSLFQRDERPLAFAAGGPWKFTHDELVQLVTELAAHESARRTGETQVPPRPQLQDGWKQAVLGARVARQLGLGLAARSCPRTASPASSVRTTIRSPRAVWSAYCSRPIRRSTARSSYRSAPTC